MQNCFDSALTIAVKEGNLESVRKLLHTPEDCSTSSLLESTEGYILLCESLKNGHLEISELLLKGGVRTNRANNIEENTPLHLAVKMGNVNLTQILLIQSASPKAKNVRGETPLHIAADNGFKDCASLLLTHGAHVDSVDDNELTPLHIAVKQKNLEMVECILQNKPNVYAKKNQAALKTAICVGSEEIFNLLRLHKLTLHPEDVIDARFLLLLVTRGDLRFVKYLLESGANPNKITGALTPLHAAVKEGHKDVVELLLDSGCDVNILNACEEPAIDYSIHYSKCDKSMELFKLLLSRGAAISSSVWLLHEATQKGCVEVFKILVQSGADINFILNGKTPLHTAVEEGQLEIVKLLLDRGCNVNVLDRSNKLPIHYTLDHANGNEGLEIFKLLFSSDAQIVKSVEFLHNAVEKKCFEVIKILIVNGADPNCTFKGKTMLHLAAKCGCKEVVEFLVKAGCSINITDEAGKMPIDYCTHWFSKSYAETDEIIRLLLASGAKIRSSAVLLHDAVRRDSFEICKLLIENGVDVNVKDENEKTPLYYTADIADDPQYLEMWQEVTPFSSTNQSQSTDKTAKMIIAELLIKSGANVNAKTRRGLTTLHCAAMSGFEELIDLLITSGADVNALENIDYSPLAWAIRKRRPTVVELLLKRGANVNAVYPSRKTSLHQALNLSHNSSAHGEFSHPLIQQCLENIIEILKRHGVDMNALDERNETALHTAASMLHVKVIPLLMDHGAGAHINLGNVRGLTPLHLALEGFAYSKEKCFKDVAGVLVKYGADVNARTMEDETPLHFALKKFDQVIIWDLIEDMLNRGADVNAKTKKGDTPLHIVAAGVTTSFTSCLPGRKELIELLLKFGAEIDRPNRHGKTALHLASGKGFFGIVEVLLKNRADVNLLTNQNLTAFDLPRMYSSSASSEDDSDNDEYTDPDEQYVSIRYPEFDECTIDAVGFHIIKLKTAGLNISQRNFRSVRQNLLGVKKYTQKCKKELKKLKSRKLFDSFTLNDLLLGTKSCLYLRNKSLAQVLESVKFDKYKIYGGILECTYKNDKFRYETMVSAAEWFNVLTRTSRLLNSNGLSVLPTEVTEIIMSHLNFCDLRSLIFCGRQLQRQLQKQSLPMDTGNSLPT